MKASDHAGVLPVLAESPRRQVVLSGLWVVLFVLLLTAAAVRIGAEVQPTWWLPVALFLGMAAADFGSGLVHWAADTWGRADLPCIGPRVLLPFRLHHVNPDDFLRRSFLDTNGDAAAGMVPILALLLWMPLDTTQWQAAGPFLFALCAFGGLTNQIHQWAHVPSAPPLVRLCQQCDVFLPPVAHAAHHAGEDDAHYCITTGWCNRPLESVGFFRRLEEVVTRLTGALPRNDDHAWAEQHRATADKDAQDG